MSVVKSPDLQKQIEDIDTELYNLLMKRTELVKQQGDTNAVANTLGREATAIKKLLKNHHGDFPEYVIAKIWREILSASACLKEKLRFSIFGQEHNNSLINIVQEHFGSYVDYETYGSFGQVINALTAHEVQLAVIPCHNHDMNLKPWWNSFSAVSEEGLQVIAKLPFVCSKEAKTDDEVYVVSLSVPDQSGADITLLSIETACDVSSSSLNEELEKIGFKDVKVLLTANIDDETKSMLVEVNGYVRIGDKRLEQAAELYKNLKIVGAYARPVYL